MNKIVSDYRKRFYKTPVKHWILCLLYCLLMFSNGYVREKLRFAAICGAAGFTALALWSSLDILVITPLRFKKRMNALPENERSAIEEQYGSAPVIGERHFLSEHLICFFAGNIVLVKFSEIRSAELKGFKLLLDIGRKKPLKMPFSADENPALLVAAMRSRNPNISVIINGKVVEKMEKNK